MPIASGAIASQPLAHPVAPSIDPVDRSCRSILWLTLRVVWFAHRCVFRGAGWRFGQFARAAMTELDRAIDSL
jgi:hypothetical protein